MIKTLILAGAALAANTGKGIDLGKDYDACASMDDALDAEITRIIKLLSAESVSVRKKWETTAGSNGTIRLNDACVMDFTGQGNPAGKKSLVGQAMSCFEYTKAVDSNFRQAASKLGLAPITVRVLADSRYDGPTPDFTYSCSVQLVELED